MIIARCRLPLEIIPMLRAYAESLCTSPLPLHTSVPPHPPSTSNLHQYLRILLSTLEIGIAYIRQSNEISFALSIQYAEDLHTRFETPAVVVVIVADGGGDSGDMLHHASRWSTLL